jgi:hypothetical protein
MSTTSREIIKGVIGGIGFLASAFLFDLPLLLAGLIGVGLFVSVGLMLPKPPAARADAEAPGLTVEERDQFLAACRKHTAALVHLSGPLGDGDFGQTIKALIETSENLHNYLAKKPEAILLAYSIPQTLEHLAGMLRQYMALRHYTNPGPTVDQALRQVEEIFASARSSLAGMHQQLLHHDVTALERSTQTLAILMGVEAQVAEETAKYDKARAPTTPSTEGKRPPSSTRRPSKEREQ